MDEEEAERQKILQAAPENIRAFFSWSFKRADADGAARSATDQKVNSLGLAVESQGKKLTEISKRQDSVESRLAVLEGTGSVGTGSTAAGSAKSMATPTFAPTYVECYGWVKDWTSAVTRARTMIADDQAALLLTNAIAIIQKSDDLLVTHIDAEGSKRAARSKPMSGSLRIRFKKGTEDDILFQAQAALAQVNDDSNRRHELFVGMAAPLDRIRFRVEAPPWKVPHNQAVGRFHGEWSKLIPNVPVMGTSGAGKTPSFMWTDPYEGKRMQFAEYRPTEFGGSGQWKILPEAWAVFSQRHSIQQSPEQVEAAVATRS